MDLRQLRHFAAVAEELHFGRAAERLGMTQPPLSQSIQALEEELGVRLFERTKRTVDLTPVGAQWRPHAQAVLDAAAALPGLADRLRRGEAGSLRMAFVSVADYNVLPTLVRRYKERFPGVEITLREATSDEQIRAVGEGTIDLGLIVRPPQASFPPALEYRRLWREPLVLAAPSAWVESGRVSLRRERVAFASIRDEPLIVFPRAAAPALHDIITRYYHDHGARARIGQEAVQMQTIISLVSAGLGVALVPASLKNLALSGVEYLPLSGRPPEIETGLIWPAVSSLPAVRHFLEVSAGLAAKR